MSSALLPTRLRTAANGMKGIHSDVAREAADEIERLRRMVRDAYNEGFSQGTREHTSSTGGVPWSDCDYRMLVENNN